MKLGVNSALSWVMPSASPSEPKSSEICDARDAVHRRGAADEAVHRHLADAERLRQALARRR